MTSREGFDPAVMYEKNWRGEGAVIVDPDRGRREKLLGKVNFEGYTPEREARMRQMILDSGLPIDNLKEVVYAKNDEHTQGRLGLYDYEHDRLTMYSLADEHDPLAELFTLAHELNHQCQSFDGRNDKMFKGGREGREVVRDEMRALAEQTRDTKKFLSGYQKWLFKQWKKGGEKEADWVRFCRETETIVSEMRLDNRQHLEQVVLAQQAEFTRKNLGREGREFVNALDVADHKWIAVSKTVNTSEQIDAHANSLRLKYARDPEVREKVLERTVSVMSMQRAYMGKQLM